MGDSGNSGNVSILVEVHTYFALYSFARNRCPNHIYIDTMLTGLYAHIWLRLWLGQTMNPQLLRHCKITKSLSWSILEEKSFPNDYDFVVRLESFFQFCNTNVSLIWQLNTTLLIGLFR